MAEAPGFLSFRDKAIELLKRATTEDEAKNYSQALELYQNGIQHLVIAIKCISLFSFSQLK